MATQPKVVLLQLEKQPFFNEQYAGLLKDLKAKANVQEIKTAAEATTLFTGSERPVVFATDEALSLPEYRKQKAESALFVRNGGTLIFGAHFPSFAIMPNIDSLFSGFSLPWTHGDYHRTNFDLNADMQAVNHAGLVQRYSQKALHLADVQRSDALYLPADEARIQSRVFAPTPIEDRTQTPAALASVGEGKVGYLGDVNGESGTDKVVMAMLGLN